MPVAPRPLATHPDRTPTAVPIAVATHVPLLSASVTVADSCTPATVAVQSYVPLHAGQSEGPDEAAGDSSSSPVPGGSVELGGWSTVDADGSELGGAGSNAFSGGVGMPASEFAPVVLPVEVPLLPHPVAAEQIRRAPVARREGRMSEVV